MTGKRTNISDWLVKQRSKFISGYTLYKWKKFVRTNAVVLNCIGGLLIIASIFLCPWCLFATIPLEMCILLMTLQNTKSPAVPPSSYPARSKTPASKPLGTKTAAPWLKNVYSSFSPKLNYFFNHYGLWTVAFLFVLLGVLCNNSLFLLVPVVVLIMIVVSIKKRGGTPYDIVRGIFYGIIAMISAAALVGGLIYIFVVISVVGKNSPGAAFFLFLLVIGMICGAIWLWKACQRDPKLAKTVQIFLFAFFAFSLLNSLFNKSKKP